MRLDGHTDRSNELHLDAGVLQSFSILGSDRHGTLDRLAIHVQRDPFATALVELDVDRLTVITVVENDVDIDGGGEEERRHGEEGSGEGMAETGTNINWRS